MAHEFLGPRMKAGYKKQTTFGTAESLGANDQICWHGDIVFDDAAELVATCGGKRQSTRTTKRQPTASMKMSPPDFGQFILLLYQLMGARTSDPNGNAIRGDGSVGYSMECTWEDSPAIIGTFLACMDGDSKLVELEGCMIKKLTITINAVTGLQVVVDLIANRGYHSDDSDITNTATEAAALTYRHTIDVDAKVFPPACILDRIWLAPREQSTFTSADKICPNEVVIEIVNPYEDMHFDACSDAHQPMVVEARDWIYTLKFASPNEWTYHTRKKTSAPLKIKVEAQGQHGGIGSSYSDTSPATSINTATDSKMKVELRREFADGSYESDGPHEITLTGGTLGSGADIAAEVQTQVRAITASADHLQEAFDGATCDYDSTMTGRYVLLPTPTTYKRYRFIVTDGSSANVADDLSLGTGNSGTETASIPNAAVFMNPSCRVIETPNASIVDSGYMPFEVKLQACANAVSSVAGFTTSDEPRLESDFGSTPEEGRILSQSWSDYDPAND